MQGNYELIEYQVGLPVRIFVHRVNEVELHWHNELEIIFVLKGTVSMKVGQDHYVLKEKDILLINRNEVHSTYQTGEDNLLLAFQINSKFCSSYYPELGKMAFDVKSFLIDDHNQERFDKIRHYLANMMWVLNKKIEGTPFQLVILVNSLLQHLVQYFNPTFIDDGNVKSRKKNLERLDRIIKYVDEHYAQKISLQEISNQEYLSVYYLSHFFKDHVGISFQEYVVQKRLQMSVELLLHSDKTITEIAANCGFSDSKLFYKHFKKKYKCKPLEYKQLHSEKAHHQEEGAPPRKGYLDIEHTAIFENLFAYQQMEVEGPFHASLPPEEKSVVVHLKLEGKPFAHYWRKLVTFGRAAEGMRENLRNQLREIQKEIGFEYVRFHGIFNDDMMVCNRNAQGEIVYNWTYVDQLFDFLQEIGMKPFLELSFMPSELKKSDETVFWWRGNISPPADMQQWTALVTALIKHCVNRYGMKEVRSWYFEVWNEPDYEGIFWGGSKEEYFELYKQTATAIHAISTQFRVGGPGIAFPSQLGWMKDFLHHCDSHQVPLDFISYHIYCEHDDREDGIIETSGMFDEMMRDSYGSHYCGRHHTSELAKRMKETIGASSAKTLELHTTEWNVSHSSRNLIQDTAFMAPFIISNVLKSVDAVDSLGYWTCSDIFEEFKAGLSPFHGGFGLMNHDGIKKSSYFAYYLLSKLGEELLEQGEDYIVTKRNGDIQILAYHYVYFDYFFRNGDQTGLSQTERYSVYEECPPKRIKIRLKGLQGTYRVTTYVLNREHGSAFDEWVRMGAPAELTGEFVSYLKKKAYPQMNMVVLHDSEEFETIVQLPAHGVELIVLEQVI
ncbi:helix-turn-helix domain-containing protein [Brevibacillus fluminis]|uniref:Helix-turn-helix domain-containing protein n=1 Tax=Brevibacillus fluminis TaxID=511487 RepID=A0A3M8DNL7_9BACL|nr:helix-turn-helix domain-containing protein [Brevibacillus fluminis]RNB89690.1 helix-turn-helix domain-containing protein [Brevibacillus fluminis]